MNHRAHGKRTCAAAFGVVVALGALAASGCHNTWQGVKEDTHNAVQKTGHGLEKAGEKMEGTDKKNKAPPPPAKGSAPSGGSVGDAG